MSLSQRIIDWAQAREPDFLIGADNAKGPQVRRWYVTPWSAWHQDVPRERRTRWQRLIRALPNVFVHQFLRSDDDRACHDHPWPSVSVILSNCYFDHTIAAGGIHHRQLCCAGDVVVRARAKSAHRVELVTGPCWTLFITGLGLRDWGFHCESGWVPWRRFGRRGCG